MSRLPVEKRDDPIKAYKRAFLIAAPYKNEDGLYVTKLRFRANNQNGQSYTQDERAICIANNKHYIKSEKPPQLDCTCGFYAYKAPEYAVDHATDPNSVLLIVDLSGHVIEHQLGYRAERQQVLRVVVPIKCTSCNKPAVGIRLPDDNIFGFLQQYCSDHKTKENFYTLAEIAEKLGTEVLWSKKIAPHAVVNKAKIVLLPAIVTIVPIAAMITQKLSVILYLLMCILNSILWMRASEKLKTEKLGMYWDLKELREL